MSEQTDPTSSNHIEHSAEPKRIVVRVVPFRGQPEYRDMNTLARSWSLSKPVPDPFGEIPSISKIRIANSFYGLHAYRHVLEMNDGSYFLMGAMDDDWKNVPWRYLQIEPERALQYLIPEHTDGLTDRLREILDRKLAPPKPRQESILVGTAPQTPTIRIGGEHTFRPVDRSAFDRRRDQLLAYKRRIQTIHEAQPLASNRCILCLRIGEEFPAENSTEWLKVRCYINEQWKSPYLDSPIPSSKEGAGGRFALYQDREIATTTSRRFIEALDQLAAIAREHLQGVGIDFGQYPDDPTGWLWLVYLVAWNRPGVGYSIKHAIYETTPDRMNRRVYVDRQEGGPSVFASCGYRWGEWSVDLTEKHPPYEIYILSSDLLTSSCFAIQEIVDWADQKVAMRDKAREILEDPTAEVDRSSPQSPPERNGQELTARMNEPVPSPSVARLRELYDRFVAFNWKLSSVPAYVHERDLEWGEPFLRMLDCLDSIEIDAVEGWSINAKEEIKGALASMRKIIYGGADGEEGLLKRWGWHWATKSVSERRKHAEDLREDFRITVQVGRLRAARSWSEGCEMAQQRYPDTIEKLAEDARKGGLPPFPIELDQAIALFEDLDRQLHTASYFGSSPMEIHDRSELSNAIRPILAVLNNYGAVHRPQPTPLVRPETVAPTEPTTDGLRNPVESATDRDSAATAPDLLAVSRRSADSTPTTKSRGNAGPAKPVTSKKSRDGSKSKAVMSYLFERLMQYNDMLKSGESPEPFESQKEMSRTVGVSKATFSRAASNFMKQYKKLIKKEMVSGWKSKGGEIGATTPNRYDEDDE